MQKKHIPAIVLFGTLIFSSTAFAQETTTTTAVTQTPTATSSPVTKQNIRAEEKARRNTLNEERTAARDAFKEQLDAAKGKYQTQREALKKRLEALKDERKKEIIERISDKIAMINEKRTTHMSDALKRLTTLLGKVQDRINEAKQKGMNTTLAETAFASAQAAITKSQSAVTAQAGKTYPIAITTDERAKNAVGATLKLLQSDLRATHQTVINARLAVMNVVRALALLKKGADEPSASTSAN